LLVDGLGKGGEGEEEAQKQEGQRSKGATSRISAH